MSSNGFWLIEFFQILLFFLRQLLTSDFQRLVHPSDTAESDDRACNPLIAPRKCDMAHRPVPFLRQFLDTRDNLGIDLSQRLVRG